MASGSPCSVIFFAWWPWPVWRLAADKRSPTFVSTPARLAQMLRLPWLTRAGRARQRRLTRPRVTPGLFKQRVRAAQLPRPPSVTSCVDAQPAWQVARTFARAAQNARHARACTSSLAASLRGREQHLFGGSAPKDDGARCAASQEHMQATRGSRGSLHEASLRTIRHIAPQIDESLHVRTFARTLFAPAWAT
jgi:hypothetical protein